jgi:hypothetical protein
MQSYSTPYSTSKSRSSTPIYAGKHVVGQVKGDTFYKTVSGNVHFLRQPPAIMFDIQSLKDAERYGAKNAHVTDRDTGDVYTAPIALIWEKPIYKDYGYGKQVGLCLKEWTVNGVAPVQPKPKPAHSSLNSQLRMF